MTFALATAVTATLRDLLVLDAADTPISEDTTVAADRCAAVVRALTARRIVAIPDTNAIADNLFDPLVAVFVEHLRPMYGGVLDPEAVGRAEQQLIDVVRLDRTVTTATGKLVTAILGRLRIHYPQVAAVADNQYVADSLQDILEDISRRVGLYVTDPNNIPPEARSEIIRFAASSIADDTEKMIVSEQRMKVLAMEGPSYLPLPDQDGLPASGWGWGRPFKGYQ